MRFLAHLVRRATWLALLLALVVLSLVVRLAEFLWHNALFTVGVGLAGFVVWYELRHVRDETSTNS